MEKLKALLKPYIEPLVKQRVRNGRSGEPVPFRVVWGMVIMAIRMDFAEKYEWLKRWLRDKNFRKNPPRPFFNAKPEEISEADRKVVDDFFVRKTLDAVVGFWMEALALSAKDCRTELVLIELDGSLLPTKLSCKDINQMLDEACSPLFITAQDVRDILRAVRQSLPAQILPEAVKGYLESIGVDGWFVIPD